VSLAGTLRGWLAAGMPAILVRIAQATGSTPREAGAAMLVSPDRTAGTIGGGQLEFHTIDIARARIGSGETARDVDLPLGPQLGQCCGGRVLLVFGRAESEMLRDLEAEEAAARARRPHVIVFGAGHTGRALATALAPLPFATSLIDSREETLTDLPAGISARHLERPEEAVATAPPGAACVVASHSHALDYAITDAGLRRGDAAYVGLIGSGTKRALFARWFLQRGGSEAELARLTCPIGGEDVDDKRPEVIAALTAAELVRILLGKRGWQEGAIR
jgi:xanthine dehydrogenase accessory protein XdhC